MGKLVVRLKPGKVVLWSNTVDAPISPVLDRDGLVDHLVEHEEVTYEEAVAMVATAESHGTSDRDVPLSRVLGTNRAGPGEQRLGVDQIIEAYS